MLDHDVDSDSSTQTSDSTEAVPSTQVVTNISQFGAIGNKNNINIVYRCVSSCRHDSSPKPPEPPDDLFGDYEDAVSWFPPTEEYAILRNALNKVIQFARQKSRMYSHDLRTHPPLSSPPLASQQASPQSDSFSLLIPELLQRTEDDIKHNWDIVCCLLVRISRIGRENRSRPLDWLIRIVFDIWTRSENHHDAPLFRRVKELVDEITSLLEVIQTRYAVHRTLKNA